jgi:hypothetical protein
MLSFGRTSQHSVDTAPAWARHWQDESSAVQKPPIHLQDISLIKFSHLCLGLLNAIFLLLFRIKICVYFVNEYLLFSAAFIPIIILST